MIAYTPTADALMIWSLRSSSGIADESGEDQDAHADAHQADERQPSDPRRERTDLVTESPRRGFVGVGPAVLAALEQECDEHGGTDDRRDEERAAGIPGDAVLEDAERDGGGRHRRQVSEAPDDECGEGLHERDDAERRTDRHAGDAGAEEQGEERQSGGDRPHERRQPGDRDAEHLRPLALLGSTTHGGPEPGLAEEQGDGDHRDRGHDQSDQVVGVEDERPDRQLPVERRGDALRGGALAPHARHEQGQHGEQLGDPDRGDGEDEP